MAKADLAQRLGVDTPDVDLQSAEMKQWPDRSAGCPQPGMAYAQVITDGAEIILAHGDETFRYTSGGSSYTPTLCENRQDP